MATADRTPRPMDRRRLMKGVVWAAPTAIVATSAPALAASNALEGITVTGRCGGLGALGQGFAIVAPANSPIPAGSVLTIERSRGVSLGVGSWSLGGFDSLATLDVVNNRITRLDFHADWSGTGSVGAVLTVGLLITTTATLSVPHGYELGPTSRPRGRIQQSLLIGCSDE